MQNENRDAWYGPLRCTGHDSLGARAPRASFQLRHMKADLGDRRCGSVAAVAVSLRATVVLRCLRASLFACSNGRRSFRSKNDALLLAEER